MTNKNWHVIGLMSGTSLDGVDLAYIKFTLNQDYTFEILKKESIIYSELWKNRLQEAFGYSGEKLTKLNAAYGKFLGELVLEFIAKNDIQKLDFVASHGHTIFHRPEQGFTLQIGSGAHLSATIKNKVICDFRTQDVALGGQGAPLVPIGDLLLFKEYDFCLNLGGFANISYQDKEERMAYDICPINIVLNHYTRKMGLEYDDKGMMASKGKIHEPLLSALNQLPFYSQEQPKSLGYEFVVETVLPIIEHHSLTSDDILRTFVEHAAIQISAVINKVAGGKDKNKTSVLITGGGAFNEFMIQRISTLTASRIVIPSVEIIEFKEALIFAFLGVLRDQKEVNCLKSVTGASRNHSSGVIYNA
jgi:anhydro-N-acetylmuramic acid kinase